MENKFLQEYRIPFVGMKKKLYQFEYLIKESFLKHFEDTDIEKCNIQVNLDFDKKETFFLLNFYIDGTIQVPCDRCAEDFNQEIFGDYEVAVKFGSEENQDSDDEDVVYISKSDDFINVADLIYEFIILSIPLRCVHPKNKDGKSECNEEVLQNLNKNNKKESVDPRWAALEKLKNNIK